MHKVVLIAILFIGSLASAGALELRGLAPSIGDMGIVALVRDDGRYANSPLKSWFDRLASGNGLCCSFADGYWMFFEQSRKDDFAVVAAVPD